MLIYTEKTVVYTDFMDLLKTQNDRKKFKTCSVEKEKMMNHHFMSLSFYVYNEFIK